MPTTPTATSWKPAPSKPKLYGSEIHVWRTPLNVSAQALALLAVTLDPDEESRAARFHFDHHRNQFIAGRGWLRSIIAWYLNTRPADLHFDYSSYGKPSICGVRETKLRFNLAHSGEFALYAFSMVSDLGIDIELINPEFASDTVATQFFSANEVNALLEFPPSERAHAFFDCWTRKEAFIKAQGMGLSLPLDEFEVSLNHDEAALLCTKWDLSEAAKWLLMKVDVAPDYAAALAIPAGEYSLKYFYVDEQFLVPD